MRLSWNDESDDESIFRLERRAGEGFALVAAVAAGSTGFVDVDLAPETDYSYRVRAQNGAGPSPYSAEATVTTLPDLRPAAPSNLRAAPLSSQRIRLTWQDNSDDETSFALSFREALSGAFIEIPYAVPPATTTLLISQLDPATDYAFRVRARNAFGTSEASNTATVTTFADDLGAWRAPPSSVSWAAGSGSSSISSTLARGAASGRRRRSRAPTRPGSSGSSAPRTSS